jgi:ATP-dependent Lhr-like helicase
MSARPGSCPSRRRREWFAEAFAGPTRAQQLAWPVIASGASALVFAPTGSGKTLAAFLAATSRLMFAPPPRKGERCRVVYVSPLKALAVDVERNLRVPIAGIAAAAERRGDAYHVPLVGIRTGTRRRPSGAGCCASRPTS